MSNSTITFFPVDNGGMALLKLNDSNETTILVDIHIRESDDENDYYDVADYLRKQLKEIDGKPHVDVFLLTHNDDDHIKGLQKHFHLGAPDEYEEADDDEEPKIVVKEMWSSARFWKRASESNKLSEDAKGFNREVKRRVQLFEDDDEIQESGDRALIIGNDPDGKTDHLSKIVRDIGSTFSKVNELELKGKLSIKVLSPLPQQEDESEEDSKKSNRSSVILQLSVQEGDYSNKLLLGADAEVFVWDSLWNLYKNSTQNLEYDILLTPHHCSWHSLSYDSYSKSDDPQVSSKAISALGQAKEGAFIISSSKPIKDDGNDPPSFAAKEEYLSLIDSNHFLCTQEYPAEKNPEPIVINLTDAGPQLKSEKSKAKLSTAAIAATGESFPHGE